ncbi:hypothetical protein Tco_0623407 [Tanacetum coccineum]
MENDDRDWMYFPRREEVGYEDDENEDMEDDLRLNNTATVIRLSCDISLALYSSQRWHGPSLDGCTFRTRLNVVPFSRVSCFAIQEKFPVLFSITTDNQDLAPEEDGSGEDGSAYVDPFLAVMNKEYNGHWELMESVRNAIDCELNRLVEKRKHIEDDQERKKLEIGEEHKRNKVKLEDMRNEMCKEIEDQRDKLVEDVVQKLIQKLPPEVFVVIMEYLVKISKKARILELKRRHLKIIVLTSNTPYPSRKIRRICACTSLKTTKDQGSIRRIQRRPIRRIQFILVYVLLYATYHSTGSSDTDQIVRLVGPAGDLGINAVTVLIGGDGAGDGVGGGVEVRGGGAWRSRQLCGKVMMVVSVGRQPEKGVDVVAVVAAGGRRRRVEERGEWIG